MLRGDVIISGKVLLKNHKSKDPLLFITHGASRLPVSNFFRANTLFV